MNFTFFQANSLDEAIDSICEVLGEDKMDDALKEDFCPYFCIPWEAGLGLAEFLNAQPMPVSKLNVLEIGCGLALPSFVLSQKGYQVTACDFHDDVASFLKLNQSLNAINFSFKKLNWREGNTLNETFDLVIGSDILYESNHPRHVASTLISFVKPGGKIILSDPGRNYIRPFLDAMNEKSQLLQTINFQVNQSWTKKDITIFIFTKI